jgi:branched-chain amino acid transport system permease protein
MDAATNLLQLVLSGILVGSVYSLTAMGFVVAYRSANVFNISYGQFAVLGAFIAWTFLGSPQEPRLPLPLALGLTLLAVVAFGLVVERVLFRRMIGRPLFATFILSLGLLAVLHGAIMLAWGPGIRVLATRVSAGPVNVGSLVVSREFVWSFAIAVIATLAFVLFFRFTRLGLAMRAAYDDQVAARCLGVSARLNSQITWVLSAVIATIGGILMATVNGVSIELSQLVMVVLAVALVGGMDSLVGAVFGGLLLAVGMNLTSYYLSPLVPGIDSIFSMLLILAVLLIRPTGLMGTRPIERV